MSKRKVLFIHETMNGGGAERVLLDLLRHMDYMRYDVTLLLVCATGVYVEQLPDEVKLLCLHRNKKPLVERVLFRCKPLLDRWQERHINRVLGGERYDTIVSFLEGPAMIYHSMVASRASRNVTWVHTDLKHFHWTGCFHGSLLKEQQRYSLMDDVVVISREARAGYEAIMGKHPHLHVQHNPIDRDSIVARSLEVTVPKRRFTVCNIGRLIEVKRQERIIGAAAMLRERGLEIDFWIMGTGNREAQLKAQARLLGVDDIVKFAGFVTNPYPMLRAADALVVASDAEGYPTVVCEALCLGKPVVSTPVAGIDELLHDGAGIVCEPSEGAIADAVECLACDRECYDRLAQASQLGGRQFDINVVMQSIEKML